eukprot:3503948-Amphidinium_carterae.1
MEDDERSLKHAYLAALMREICRITTKDWTGSVWDNFKALILVATFDHYDLQQLVLEEDNSHGYSKAPQHGDLLCNLASIVGYPPFCITGHLST